MATVKVKFRASSVKTREGTLYFQVIHNRVARQVTTDHKLFPSEWDRFHSRILLSECMDDQRREYLLSLNGQVSRELAFLKSIIFRMGVVGLRLLPMRLSKPISRRSTETDSSLSSVSRWSIWRKSGVVQPSKSLDPPSTVSFCSMAKMICLSLMSIRSSWRSMKAFCTKRAYA